MGDLPPAAGCQPLDGMPSSPTREQSQNPVAGTSSPPQSGPLNSNPLSRSSSQNPQLARNPTRTHGSDSGGPRYEGPKVMQQESSGLDMSSVAGAFQDQLSDAGPGPLQPEYQQRSISGNLTSGVGYQLQQSQQLRDSAALPFPPHPTYNHGYGHGPFQPNFAQAQGLHYGALGSVNSSQQRQNPNNILQHPYQSYQQPSPYIYYSPYGHPGAFPQTFSTQTPQPQIVFTRRSSLPSTHGPAPPQSFDLSLREGTYPSNRTTSSSLQADSSPNMNFVEEGRAGAPGANRLAQSSALSSIPRGPPRKPKQSGHALWVGNLPPGTTVVDLKDHFSRDATKDIESLFLISKSNCAFVNYRTEASCMAAMHRFHDSRFQGVRLVCRLRRTSAPASGIPLGPSAMFRRPSSSISEPQSPSIMESREPVKDGVTTAAGTSAGDTLKQHMDVNAKYFVLKSLTLQDLELSVRNGIWTTQSHNEEVLNKAFQTVQNVYLIFSANKSGEYFGYARMLSPIMDDAQLVIDPAPNRDYLDSVEIPKSIPTPATDFAPKGRIIDDSARGTIFWEAEQSDSDAEEGDTEKTGSHMPQGEIDGSAAAQTWGKPFRIEWISTNRVPFYRTRGLRNPWNANREVKIARDGTELETSVGARLVHMFHRLGPSDVGATTLHYSPMQGHQPPMY